VIDRLRVAKSAHFYKRRKRLAKAAIVELFRSLRNQALAPSNNLFHHLKESIWGASWSAIAFFHEREPAFLDLPVGTMKERLCGYIMLIEYREHIVIFKSGLDLPSPFKIAHLRSVPDDRVEMAVAYADAVFEQIRLRSMGTSKFALRTKTLEADDLQNVVPPSGTNRFVPRGYRTRRGDEHYAVTPNTGRISMRSDRVGLEPLVKWTTTVVDRLIDNTIPSAPFIRQFARSIDLANLPPDVEPLHLAIDIQGLKTDLLEDTAQFRLERQTGENRSVLGSVETASILKSLERTFEVRKVRKELRLYEVGANVTQVGKIELGKSRIALRYLDVPEIANLFIVNKAPIPGEETDPIPLRRFVDQNNLFTVLFTDFAIVYLEGSLYKDPSIIGGGEAFLAHFRSDPILSAVDSEKGSFSANQLSFDSDSVFGALINRIAAADEVLICDDLGDEWADFIGVCVTSQPKTISFYHAKHGDVSLSASAFHIAVGQAIKNLGRMHLSQSVIAGKLHKWSSTYNADGVATSIPRIANGANALQQNIEKVASSPDSIRRVFIVTSSLSRAQLVTAFEEIRRGSPPKAYFVQMYWLLNSFFSACVEVGAFPYVICRE
jgi:hypothetical protein